MQTSLLFAMLWLSAGQVAPATDPKAQSAARLKFMKETAARIEIHEDRNAGKKIELAAQPVLRWDNPRSFVVDAATFVWLADHRPQAIGGIWIKNGHSFFELQSLSQQPLTATVDGKKAWSAPRPGIEWQMLSDAPVPAAARGERLRQMKQLAQGFSVHAIKNAPDYDEGSVWRFRMMAQPVHRYAEEAAVDGAIFAFAQGTDPEAFLLFEAIETEGARQWHYAFAAACSWELHAQVGEREVWSVPRWKHQDPKNVYDLIGPFAVDPALLPNDLKKSNRAD